MLTDEKRKELLKKRKYYREHPEEARKEYVKKYDGYVPVGTPPENKTQVKKPKKEHNFPLVCIAPQDAIKESGK